MTTISPVSVISPSMNDRELKRQFLQSQIDELDEQDKQALLEERKPVISNILAAITKYGITKEDLFPKKNATKGNKKSSNPPKYKDPDSDKTWSGFGNAPKFIKGKNKDDFLIVKAVIESPTPSPVLNAEPSSVVQQEPVAIVSAAIVVDANVVDENSTTSKIAQVDSSNEIQRSIDPADGPVPIPD
jgi:DNA-binding protein H-NS